MKQIDKHLGFKNEDEDDASTNLLSNNRSSKYKDDIPLRELALDQEINRFYYNDWKVEW